jgi:crotonobetainyl-CoA:carnitine CoA-transferase CaiB-like acyl-CoA transferase
MILELGDHHMPNTHKVNMETALEKAHTIWP